MLFRDAGVTRAVDLCSGAGGPWPGLQQELRAAGCTVDVRFEERHKAAGFSSTRVEPLVEPDSMVVGIK